MIDVLIADADPLVRAGLRSIVDTAPGLRVRATVATGRAALDELGRNPAEVVVAGADLPVGSCRSVAAAAPPSTGVLVLAHERDLAAAAAAVASGADGLLVHGHFGRTELVAALRRVAAGHPLVGPRALTAVLDLLRGGAPAAPDDHGHPLTRREAEVMDLVAQGHSNHEIAERLVVSDKTVKNHLNRAYRKLHARDRAQAVARWLGSAPPEAVRVPA